MEKEINLNKKYNIPQNIFEVFFEERYIIISVDTANWIILENENQRNIFYKLIDNDINNVFNFYKKVNLEDDFIKVITEIEAKRFEDININRVKLDGLCLYVTNKCNLRCKHCYMYSGVKDENELNLKEIEELLYNFKKCGGTKVTFTGGEVAERLDFIKLLEFTKNMNLKVTVLTNGTKWNDIMIEKAALLIDEVQVSIDGYDELSNSKIRGKNKFNLSMKTIEKFLNTGVKVSVAVTPLYDSLRENKENYILFAQNLINKYKDKEFHIKFNYELLNGRDIEINEEENKNYSNIMHEIVDACYKNSDLIEFVINNSENFILNNCGYGGITVSANGNIYFCNRIHELKSYANIRENSFTEIIELSKKAMNKSDINNLKPCKDCHLKYICGGGCRIKYFNQLTQLEDFNLSNNFSRICDQQIKEKYYRLMIESNEYLYK